MKLFAGSYSYSFSLLLNFCIFKGMFKRQNTPFVVESSLSNIHSHIIFYKFYREQGAKCLIRNYISVMICYCV